MKVTVFEAFVTFVKALFAGTKNEKLVGKLTSSPLPEDQDKLIEEFDSAITASLAKIDEGETITWQKAMLLSTYLLFSKRVEIDNSPSVSHLGASEVDFITVPISVEDDEIGDDDEILMSESLTFDGQQSWRILGEACSMGEYGDHRQLAEYGPESCKIEGDPLWWTVEERDPMHHLDEEVYSRKLGINWDHLLPLSDARDQVMWLLFWNIKDATTVEQLAEVARKARSQSQAAILRKQGKTKDKNGKWIPIDTSKLPVGLDYSRFARVINAATKKAAWILKCDVSTLSKPFGTLKIEDRSTPKEEKPEVDALDAPKAGEFMIDLSITTDDVVEIGYRETTKDWVYTGTPNLVYHMSPEEIEEFNPQYSHHSNIQSFRMSDAEVIAWKGNRSIR